MRPCKKNIFTLALVSVFLVLLAACSSHDEDPESQVKYLPSKIISEGEISTTTTTYDYDNINRLVRVIKTESYTQGDVMNEIVLDILYNDFNKISHVIKTTKVADLVLKADTETRDTIGFRYSGNSVLTRNSIIDTDSGNRVTRHITFTENPAYVISSKIYEYDYEGKLKAVTFEDEEAGYRNQSEYDYDSGNGIFGDVNTPQWFLATQLDEKLNLIGNNIQESLTETGKDPLVTTRTYNYNDDGYPVSESVYYSGYSLTVDVKPITIEYTIGR